MAKTLEEYLRENPNLKLGQADMDLGRQNFGALEEIIKARQDWANATTKEEKDAAHNRAENIRKYYGSYSGGTDGMSGQYSPTYVKPSSAAQEDNIQAIFDRLNGAYKGNAPTWTPKYESEIEDILGEIGDYGPFEYDLMGDPMYQQYRDQYIREGKRAMEDTAAQTAAMTGGYGSTYGATAAQQSYDRYLEGLNDVVPQLEQNAYGRYRDELGDLYNQMGALQQEESRLFNQYAAERGFSQADRDFAYNAMLAAMNQNNYENEFDRGIFESDRDFDFNEGTTKWQMTQEERQNAIDNALAIGDIEALKELGYDTTYLEFLQQVERAQGSAAIRQAQQAYTAGKSSSSSSKKSSSSKSSGSSSGTKSSGSTGSGISSDTGKTSNGYTFLYMNYKVLGDTPEFEQKAAELIQKGMVTKEDYEKFKAKYGN